MLNRKWGHYRILENEEMVQHQKQEVQEGEDWKVSTGFSNKETTGESSLVKMWRWTPGRSRLGSKDSCYSHSIPPSQLQPFSPSWQVPAQTLRVNPDFSHFFSHSTFSESNSCWFCFSNIKNLATYYFRPQRSRPPSSHLDDHSGFWNEFPSTFLPIAMSLLQTVLYIAARVS